MAHLLSQARELWAEHVRADAAPGLARVFTGYLMALSTEVGEEHFPQLLGQIRSGLVQRAAST